MNEMMTRLFQLNRCGTLGGSDHSKREVKNTKPTKNYMWNTVTIQYNPLIEEEWDEHFKVTQSTLKKNPPLFRSLVNMVTISGKPSPFPSWRLSKCLSINPLRNFQKLSMIS